MEIKVGKTKLSLVSGDIIDQNTDAIVNAANRELRGGSGVNGAIHAKGGPRIYEECRNIGSCAVGDAVLTTGGDLKARHVIHAVGPVWHDGKEGEPELLASAYRRSLEVAVSHHLQSIAFPAISTGVYGFPLRLAAPVALTAIIEFLRQQPHELEDVRVVLFTGDDVAYTVFVSALEQILSKRTTT
jgi:O-acetyl-ADP-ribose deacetylase (regulator of RNase III)